MRPLMRVSLKVTEDLLPQFCPLLDAGFLTEARTGYSIRDLPCG
jgi:hypothetical protein